MGIPMAKNLHKAGLLAAVWNRTHEKASTLAAELGCVAPALLAEFARGLDVAVVCVSADADVRSVIEGMAPGLAKGALVIDCSTVSADTARWAEQFLATRGVAFLDAPVSGGVEGAQKGTLAIMTGGAPDAFEKARPVLQAMARLSNTSARRVPARRPRRPTRSWSRASSARSQRRWLSPARTRCRSRRC